MRHPANLLLVCGLILGLSSVAMAQSSPPAERQAAAASPATSRIDRYAKVLTLDAAQTEAAKSLYDAYQKETAAAGKKMREALKDAQDQMNDGDHKAFEERMGQGMRDHAAASKKLTDSFLSDLRSILKPEQADRWPSFERLRRREQYLTGIMSMGGAAPGGSTVDLFPLIDKLGIPGSLRTKVDEQLALYEIDLDRPLQDRQHHMEDEQVQMGGGIQHFDADSFAKKQERDRAVDMAIREVNTRYVRQIGSVLPEDLAKKLAEAYDARAYRGIYKDSTISRKMAAAQKLADLSAEQKKSLQSMIDRYRKDAKVANDRWAAAQKAAEDAGRPTGGGLMFAGPGSVEKVDPDFAAARSSRRDVDNAAREQLEKLLSPEQLAAIPQPAPAGMLGGHRVEVFGDGTGADMVFTGDVDMPDDMEPGMGGAPVVIMRTVDVGGSGPHAGDQPAGTPANSPPPPPPAHPSPKP
jgi:hypothetical protein